MNFDDIPVLNDIDKKLDLEQTSEIIPIFEAAKKMLEARGGRDRIPIGFESFSKIMNGGITDGDLVVISGRPGSGKTFFAQTLSYHLHNLGFPQLWFSYEMEIVEIADRFRNMGLSEDFIGFCPFKLKGGQIEWIEKKVSEAVLMHNVKVVFIDHLGFLSPKLSGDNAERNFSVYLGQICRQLKLLALEKHIVIVLLAHVRKTKEELDLDDIAHSGGVAQEADFVFMVEREKKEIPKRPRRFSEEEWENEQKINFEGDIFTKFSRISLVKNRRTGINKFIRCEVVDGRLKEIGASTHGQQVGEIFIG
ncbi:DnaB helicase C-terminal domain-containing protein [Candidatus Dojkabacteria bacterium]|jgi:replicative DNA helicase|nr:DnaB helicase C-terminal domain-containing protein [Candidatus Dojkabacteria bacterium]